MVARMPTPERSAFQKRIYSEGQYEEYESLRLRYTEKIKKLKGNPALAWQLAALQYKAPEGVPHEVAWTPHLREWLKLIEGNEAVDPDQVWADLTFRVDSSKQAKPRERIEWIYLNMRVPPESIDPEEVPDRGVVAQLELVQSSLAERAAFYKDFMAKTIPNKTQIEREARFTDDNRPVLANIEAFEASLPLDDEPEELVA
jgi:hypothetical protein